MILLPVLDFSTNFNLHLVRVVRNDKIDEVLCSWFELELAFKEIAYAQIGRASCRERV